MQAIIQPCRCSMVRTNSAAEDRVRRTGVEPGEAAPHALATELAEREIGKIDVGDLELATRRRLEVGSDVEHAVVIEIKSGHRPRGFRVIWLLDDADG